jgi:hypothetical protein
MRPRGMPCSGRGLDRDGPRDARWIYYWRIREVARRSNNRPRKSNNLRRDNDGFLTVPYAFDEV